MAVTTEFERDVAEAKAQAHQREQVAWLKRIFWLMLTVWVILPVLAGLLWAVLQ